METEDQNIIQLELKYCERCGGLWVRRAGSEDPYCAPCAIQMADLASPTRRKNSPRLPVNHKSDKKITNTKLVLVCGQAGKA